MSVDQALRIARKLRPNLYERTVEVAKIIDPVAFGTPWTCSDPKQQKLEDTRRSLQQANAMATAQQVLKYLGVNTELDWYTILTEMAKEDL